MEHFPSSPGSDPATTPTKPRQVNTLMESFPSFPRASGPTTIPIINTPSFPATPAEPRFCIFRIVQMSFVYEVDGEQQESFDRSSRGLFVKAPSDVSMGGLSTAFLQALKADDPENVLVYDNVSEVAFYDGQETASEIVDSEGKIVRRRRGGPKITKDVWDVLRDTMLSKGGLWDLEAKVIMVIPAENWRRFSLED